jgi:hypothetical protein
MMETYEEGYPWITYSYPRSDMAAMFLGGLVICECLICGEEAHVKIPRRSIWFPPKDPNHRHAFRNDFLSKHGHPDKCQNRLLWVKPLGNV